MTSMSRSHNSALHEEIQKHSKIRGVFFSLFHLKMVESEATAPL
jgi:hypothetical protein